jgi:hypothetical protein
MKPNEGLQRDVIAHPAGCNGPPRMGTGARRTRFHIPAQHLDADIPPKGNVPVEVTIPPSGVMHFLCTFHTALGMSGARLSGNATPRLSLRGPLTGPTEGPGTEP